MSRFVAERCVVVATPGAATPPSLDVLVLARALAPYLVLRPAEVAATLRRCGVEPRQTVNAR